MNAIRSLFIIFIITIVFVGCKKDNLCSGCETATLYYTPKCSSIKGYVILDKSKETRVFQHELNEKYRRSGIKVCISYTEEGSKILTTECTTADVIKINCIEEK